MAESFVGKACPKCAYVRTASDTAPEWQCPKCEIVYAKFGQAAPPRKAVSAPSGTEHAEVASTGPEEDIGQAKLAHLSTLGNYLLPPLGTIVAIALWITKSGKDELVVDSAKEALNLQISMFLWAMGVLLPAFVFPPFIFVTSFALVALLIAGIVMPILGAVRVSDGVRYYYPYTWHIFGDGPSQ